jgi:1-acyl-sn-glycerol-3-phosphate acyltransferase
MRRVINSIKFIWLAAWLVLATLLVFIPILIAAAFSRTGNLAYYFSLGWAWTILKVTGVAIAVDGKDNLTPGQAYVIIANHQSHFDSLALALGLGVQIRWVGKQELRRIPLFGYALYALRHILIDRTDHERAVSSIRRGVRRLGPGTSILFFPEGTRSADGRLQPFKKGAFATALEAGFPILPVTINGSREVLPKNSLVFYPGRIHLTIAPPITTKGERPESMAMLMQQTRNRLQSSLREPQP